LLKSTDMGTWFILVGPGKMPETIVSKLKKSLAESLQSTDLRKKLEDSGSAIASLEPDMPKFLRTETSKYQMIVDFAKIRE